MANFTSFNCFASDIHFADKEDHSFTPFDFRYDPIHFGSAYLDGMSNFQDSFLDAIPLAQSFFCPDPLYATLDIQQDSNGFSIWDDSGCLFESEKEKTKPKEEDVKEDRRLREEKGVSKGLTKEAISMYFYMPITQAAKELNIGLTLLKKRCRELGIKRWPHRKLMSLQTLIQNVQEMKKVESEGSEGKLKEAIQLLEREKKQLEEEPDMQLEHKTKRLRQACFKANYKKRKHLGIIKHTPHSSSSSSSFTCSDVNVTIDREQVEEEEEEDYDEEIKSLLNDPLSYKITL